MRKDKVMGFFKYWKDWFFPTEYLDKKPTLEAIRAYLPVGILEHLLAYQQKHLPYKPDTDKLGLDNFNGAALTVMSGGGDCESLAAFFKEIIIWWKGWNAEHICMAYTNGRAHDICMFQRSDGVTGWIDGKIYYGGYGEMFAFYKAWGWEISDWWVVNDIGQVVTEL
jgi:hypothetical protein